MAEHIAYVHKNGHPHQEAAKQVIPIDVIRAYIDEVGFISSVQHRPSPTSPLFLKS